MLYHVRIAGREFSVELQRRDGGWLARLPDHENARDIAREIPLDIVRVEPGVWSFVSSGVALCFRAQPLAFAQRGEWRIAAGGREWLAEIQDPRRPIHHAEPLAAGHLRLLSPMFGRVLRLLVQPGETVAAGAELMIIEAMKMQNPIRSPRAGTLLSLAVEAGSVIAAGDLLAEIG